MRLRPRQTGKASRKRFEAHAVLLHRKCKLDRNTYIPSSVRLEIQSHQLQQIFQTAFRNYPGDVNLDSNPIRIPSPYHLLFYRREWINQYVQEHSKSDDSNKKMMLIQSFIEDNKTLNSIIREYDQLFPSRKVTFNILWTIFIPGELVILNSDDIREVYRCLYVSQVKRQGQPSYLIHVEMKSFNGKCVGMVEKRLEIAYFNGTKDVLSLPVFPFKLHPHKSSLEQLLYERCGIFESLLEENNSHRQYEGLVWIPDPLAERYERPTPLIRGFSMRGRVVIDYKTFLSDQPEEKEVFRESQNGDENFVSPDDNLLYPAYMPGFALHERRWGWFLIDKDHLTPIIWKENPLRDLEMDTGIKELIRDLVIGHKNMGGPIFDDFVAGKGQGLILLLHGPPGSGKTLTAESISEHARRPLYIVTAGQLTTHISQLEDTLKKIFREGKLWNAIVLFDEADVLMRKRESGALDVNAIVSVFLRMLEYYEGVLFLTTNRPDDIDDAIRNRVQLEIKFSQITARIRSSIWRNLIRFNAEIIDIEETRDADVFRVLGYFEINGREIKNILRLATCSAGADRQNPKVKVEHLVKIMRIKYANSIFERFVDELQGLISVKDSSC
ncbi:P-loop containing nucleoside triphosphate hydrolase protein [Xylogone sp. PMI_703]|nr:P-loop containing nucleoside triphosphate hydrolase protein [Xylogone sp. PMI_703]